MGALLKCENVSLGYEGDVVTKNINFTVSSGDYLCIVGENGSGKSTLIKALLGLKPQLSGNIENVDIKTLPYSSSGNGYTKITIKTMNCTAKFMTAKLYGT